MHSLSHADMDYLHENTRDCFFHSQHGDPCLTPQGVFPQNKPFFVSFSMSCTTTASSLYRQFITSSSLRHLVVSWLFRCDLTPEHLFAGLHPTSRSHSLHHFLTGYQLQ